MEDSVVAVEKIINYRFKNKMLLEEALTHSSVIDSPSYQRLEFFGDAVLSLAVSKHLFADPSLDPCYLTRLRSANTSNERLARVAVRLGIYPYVHKNATDLTEKVTAFSEAVKQEVNVIYGRSVKVLADVVESIIGAVYIDLDYDLNKSWVIVRDLLEPMVTLDDLKKQPQPVTTLYEHFQKHRKLVEIKHRNGTSDVYVDGEFIVSGSSELDAAEKALHILGVPVSSNNTWELNLWAEIDNTSEEIKEAKQKLNTLCVQKKWPIPKYSIGPQHEKKFKCTVEIAGKGHMIGAEKKRKRHAENSAASLMIRALRECTFHGHGKQVNG